MHIRPGRALLPQSLMVFTRSSIFPFLFSNSDNGERKPPAYVSTSLIPILIHAGTLQMPQALQIPLAQRTQAVPKHTAPAGRLAARSSSLR